MWQPTLIVLLVVKILRQQAGKGGCRRALRLSTRAEIWFLRMDWASQVTPPRMSTGGISS